jgi:hypothetical protein
MTNTQIMELLRNKAINQKTQKALLITAGIITIGGVALYYYNKNLHTKFTIIRDKHTNYLNITENIISDFKQNINQKNKKIEELDLVIKNLEASIVILKNNNASKLKNN